MRALKKLISVFQALLRRTRIEIANALQKLWYICRSVLVVVITFLKRWFVKLTSESRKILYSRAFRINLAVALFIELLLIAIPYHNHKNFPNWAGPLASHLHNWIRSQEDVVMDWMISMYRGSDLPEKQIFGGNAPYSFVWLNIDEETYSSGWEESGLNLKKPESRWSNSLFTPRDRLLELIQFSVEHQAKIVIVDINLTHKTGPGGIERSDGDRVLYDYFKDYKPIHPPIVLAATIDKDQKKKSSFLDDTITGNIYWGAPTFYVETDGMIRRLKLCEKPAYSKKDAQAFPSIPLLANILIKKCGLHRFSETDFCAEYSGKWNIDANSRRIIYRMPWKRLESGDETSEILKIISVSDLYDDEKNIKNSLVMEKNIKNKIVMIGASYEDTNDSYETPLGRMPGALVIINAINSLFFDEKIPSLHIWQKLGLLTLLLFLMSVFFTRFDSFLGMVVSYIVILLILVPAILISFRACVLFDFGIPLGMVGILNTIPLANFVSKSGKEWL
ncbi:MAG: CHASE2 domain-containing protein [Desulfobacter postgatei]|uniref:CHASE2 domain-containing protein n=1 Tax=Desulfobacter postgatei TaxID=2293 RepID=UPI0023F1D464|nr:CHASE2 domain-containing protein [Desulfobacter postgatei]MDD4273550.1 CHASE2 domain-containing protein [Desulfobacter postgatei]